MSDDRFFVQRFPGTVLYFALVSVLGCGLPEKKGPPEFATSLGALEEDQNDEAFDVEPAPEAGPDDQGDDGAHRFITVDYPGSIESVVKGANSDGDVVGFYQDVGKRFHGFLLRQGSFSTIDFPGALFTRCTGINDAGAIGGFYQLGTRQHGFVLRHGNFETIDYPGALHTNVWGMYAGGEDEDGEGTADVVGLYVKNGVHGFRHNENGYAPIDVAGGINTSAWGVGRKGAIVGQYVTGGTTHGFLRSVDGVDTSFDVPGTLASVGTQVRGITSRGVIVGWFTDAKGTHSFSRSQDGLFTTINLPGVSITQIDGINLSGSLIVGDYFTAAAPTVKHGFMWWQE